MTVADGGNPSRECKTVLVFATIREDKENDDG